MDASQLVYPIILLKDIWVASKFGQLFFKIIFIFSIVLDFQNKSRRLKQSSIPFIQVPILLFYINMIHLLWINIDTFQKSIVYWDFLSFYLMSFFFFPSGSQVNIYLSCLLRFPLLATVYQTFLVLMTLTVLRSIGQVYCGRPHY